MKEQKKGMNSRTEGKRSLSLHGFISRNSPKNCNQKYLIPDYISIQFHKLNGYIFIKELGKQLTKSI